jgi:DNA-binding CsgD family transcriptional regulator
MEEGSLAHIALQQSREGVLEDAVATARRLTDSDCAFAAVATAAGRYPITLRDGLRDRRWADIDVRAGRGLGGRVLLEERPRLAANYLEDPSITGDYRMIVRAEGLRSICCVPLEGIDGVAALLYIGKREVGSPGSRAVETLKRVAELASVGIAVLARSGTPPMIGGLKSAARWAVPCGQEPQPEIILTRRETDVLQLLAEGASNRQIATSLFLAESTVKGYLRGLMEKFEAESRLAVVARARSRGLI